jgi:hypothetical protein
MALYFVFFLVYLLLVGLAVLVYKSFPTDDALLVRVRQILLGILFLALVGCTVHMLGVFGVIGVHAVRWNPVKDNVVSSPPEVIPPPSATPPLTEKEATQEAVDEHNEALKDFEAK